MEAELERLVVRILMEAGSFHTGMTATMKSLESLAIKAAEVATVVNKEMQAVSGSVLLMSQEVGASVAAANLALAPLTNFAVAAKNTVDAVGLLANVDLKNFGGALAQASGSAINLADAISRANLGLGSVSAAGSQFGGMAGNFSKIETSVSQLELTIQKFGNLGTPFAKLGTAMGELEKASQRMGAVGTQLTNLGTSFGTFKTGMGQDFNVVVNNVNGLSRALASLKTSSTGISAAGSRLEKLKQPFTDLAGPIKALDGAGKIIKGVTDGINKIAGISVDPLKVANRAITSLASALTKLNTGLTGMPSLAAFASDLGTAGGKVATAATQFSTAGAALKQFAKDMPDATALAPVIEVRKVMNSLSNTLAKLGTNTGNLTTFAGPLKTFIGDIGAVAAGVTEPMKALAGAFNSIARLTEAVKGFVPADMTKLSTSLAGFVPNFEKLAVNIKSMDKVEQLAKTLAKVGTFTNSVAEFNKISVVDMGNRFGAVGTGVETMLTKLAVVRDIPMLDAASGALERVGKFARAITKIDLTNLGPLTKGVTTLLTDLAAAPATGAMDSAKALGRVQTGLKNMAAIDPTKVVATANAAKAAMVVLNSVPVSAGASQMASVLSRVGLAMKNMGGAGGGPPSFNFSGLTGPGPGGFGAYTRAAQRATTSTTAFGTALKNMFAASDTAGFTGLQRIQASLLGLGILGVVQFARMDEELNRAVSHMSVFDKKGQEIPNGIFDPSVRAPIRQGLQKGILDLSTRTEFGPADLAKGLDKLASSGMSAAMALRALGTAEKFALANNLKMDKAAGKLVDIMGAVGLAVEDPIQHIDNMTMLSDKMTQIAFKTGSTGVQMTEAFTGRFTTMMKDTKTGLDDALILLGTYSKLDESTRGSAGGTRVSRALISLASMAKDPTRNWMSMMKGEQFDKLTGKMKPAVELLEIMGKKLSTEGGQRLGQLEMMGFDKDAIMSLEPLLQNTKAFADLRKELANSAGAAERIAKIYREGLLNQMKALFNSASAIATVFGDRLAGGLYLITSGFQKLAQAFVALNPAFQNLIVYGSLILLTFRPVMGMLMGIGAFIIGTLLSPFRLAFNVIMSVVGAVQTVGRAFAFVGEVGYAAWGILYSMIQKTGNTLEWIGGVAVSFWKSMLFMGNQGGRLFNFLIDSLVAIYNTLSDVVTQTTAFFATLGKSIMALLLNVATGLVGIITSIVSIGVAILALGPIMALVGTIATTAFAAIAAFAVTAFMALGSLATVIGTALVAAWGAFKAAALAAVGWIGASVVQINNNIRGMWEDLQAGTGDFIRTTAAAMNVIAGFFWNFRQNVTAIWKWLGKNGREAFEDVAKAGFMTIDILIANIGTAFNAVGTVITKSLTTAFKIAWEYFNTFTVWFAAQWPNMLADLGGIMTSLFASFKDNFIQLFDLIGKMVGVIGEQLQVAVYNATWGYTSAQIARATENELTPQIRAISLQIDNKRTLMEPLLGDALSKTMPGAAKYSELNKEMTELFRDRHELQKQLDYAKAHGQFPVAWGEEKKDRMVAAGDQSYFRDKRGEAIKGFDSFKPAGIDLINRKYKTTTSGLDFSGSGKLSGMYMRWLGEDIQGVFGKAFAGMKPFAGAFEHIMNSPMWKTLAKSLNIDLPTDAWDQTEKFIKRFLGGDGSGEMGPALATGKGFGTQFKQISLERTMTGGPQAESLEYKTMLFAEQTAKNTDKIAKAMTANGEQMPGSRPGPAKMAD